MKTWTVGKIEITRVVEVWDWQDDIWMTLHEGTPDMVLAHDWLQPHYATPDGKQRMNFQAFVVKAGDRRIMIDTCVGADREREFHIFCNMQTSFLEDIASVGIPAESIDTVLCTHLHFDHVGWNTRLVDGQWIPTFPNARYLFERSEYDFWLKRRDAGDHHDANHLADAIDPIIAAGLVDFVPANCDLGDGISLIPTPGHTPGHVSVRFESEGEVAVITGDLMHHPIQLAMPEHAATFDLDRTAGAATRIAFVDRFRDTPTLIIGSHFADPGAGRIVGAGSATRLVS